MSLPIVFRAAAHAEFDDAAQRYESKRVGLGADFIDEVVKVLTTIASRPDCRA